MVATLSPRSTDQIVSPSGSSVVSTVGLRLEHDRDHGDRQLEIVAH